MPWTIQTISKQGAGHPVVARLSVQSSELIKFSGLAKEDQDRVLELYINELQPRLLKCHEIFERLVERLNESVASTKEQDDGRVRSIPHVIGLRGEAESFLYEVKNYLRDLLNVFGIFFGCKLKDASALYDAKGKGDSQLTKWSAAEFGKDDNLTVLLRSEQTWVEELVRMRNAVEHPGGKSGTLTIHNVRCHPQALVPPAWSRTGRPESDVFTDMQVGMQNLLTIAEDWLVACIDKTKRIGAIVFHEVPEEQRNPECPQRLKVGFNPQLQASLAKKEPPPTSE